jgi:hypothetical protein
MDRDQALKILNEYVEELGGILSRFTKTSDGLYIDIQDGHRMREIATQLMDFINDHIPNSTHYSSMVSTYYNEGINNWLNSSSYASVEDIRGLVRSLITRIDRNPSFFDSRPSKIFDASDGKKKYDGIEVITNRFHAVVMQLRQRYNNRYTLDVNDEYDVQDLFHSLLKLYFNDIRTEEWTPSYAGSASRCDFLLPEINTIIEIKKTRESMSTKELGEQLIIDIAKYEKHPQCSKLICFVYDPEGRVTNPRGVENDLSRCDNNIDVRTIIVPKHV